MDNTSGPSLYHRLSQAHFPSTQLSTSVQLSYHGQCPVPSPRREATIKNTRRPASSKSSSFQKPDPLIASHQVFHNMYIMFSIMETIGDVPSILNILVAFPAVRQAARQWPAMMIKAILNGLAKAIRQTAVAIPIVPVETPIRRIVGIYASRSDALYACRLSMSKTWPASPHIYSIS